MPQIEATEQVDRGDVYIFNIEPRKCDNCFQPATKRVGLDVRELGKGVMIGEYCNTCAPMIAKRLKAALPQEQP